MQIIVQCIFAVIIYLGIIQNRGKQFTYLLGYGVIIPLACYFPFPILDLLNLQNRVFRLSLLSVPVTVAFRCMEAMHDTSPAVVETSLAHYVTYYTSVFDFYWIKTTKSRERISVKELVDKLYLVTCHFFCLSLLLSYLMHYDFRPFHSAVQLEQYHLTLELLAPGQLLNNYLYALLVFYTLSFLWNLDSLSKNLQGFRTVAPFHNPLFTSRSPSDFWGRKWNMTIHETLKVRFDCCCWAI